VRVNVSVASENILVIGPSWVGDMVMAQSLFKLLKAEIPDCSITVMAPGWTRPLLARMPEVDTSLEMSLAHGELALGKRRDIGRELRKLRFDRAYVLPNSFKSALIPFHAGIPRRIGWRGEWRNLLLSDCRKLDSEAYPRMVQRFAALAYPETAEPPADIPAPRLEADTEHVSATVTQFHLEPQRPVLALCPGAEFGDSKQWPPEHYADLANRQIAAGWQVWLFGSANDALTGEAILADLDPSYLKHCHNLTGATNLGQAIDLLSLATTVVSNDSGLMHVAAALGKPVVALYGSTSPEFTPPLAEKVELLATDIECRPCFKRQCPYGHRRCLTELRPERAIQAVDALNPGV